MSECLKYSSEYAASCKGNIQTTIQFLEKCTFFNQMQSEYGSMV